MENPTSTLVRDQKEVDYVHISRLSGELLSKLEPLYRKRPRVVPISSVSLDEYEKKLPEIFSLIPEASDYGPSITSEPAFRPTPHFFIPTSKQILLGKLFQEHFPEVIRYARSELITEQTVEKKSRVGFPFFSFFSEGSDKRDLVTWISQKILEGNYSNLIGPTILNIRLQPEKLSKSRQIQFIESDFLNVPHLYEAQTTPEFRNLGSYSSSRVRLVFNYAIPNLFTQLVDGTINDFYSEFPIFSHKMALRPYDSRVGEFLSYEEDLESYERYMAIVTHCRPEIIGGIYGDVIKKLLDQPIIVKSVQGELFQIKPKKDIFMQLGSGISPVSPQGKEVNLIVFVKVYSDIEKVPFLKSLDILANHKDPDIMLCLFGDDSKLIYRNNKRGNFLKNEIVERRKEYLDGREEIPGRFLGFKKRVEGKFTFNELSLESCFLNFFLDERAPGSRFRPFANFGYFERRKTYFELGEPRVKEYLLKEKSFLQKEGWYDKILFLAMKERARVNKNLPFEYVVGKMYLLSKKQRLALGLDTVISKDLVQKAIEQTNLFKI